MSSDERIGSGTGSSASAELVPTVEGYCHEIGFYGSDAEFAELILPFAEGGLAAGEPVVFAYDPYKVALLRQWLPSTAGISYVTDASPYATPAKALASWRKVVSGHLSDGAKRVRIAGNVPHPGYGRSYAGWDRYEAAIDFALGDLPVWAPCLYDTRIAPDEVLEAARQLHSCVLGRDGHHHENPAFERPGRLEDFFTPEPDSCELRAPDVELEDPSPATVRAVVRELGSRRLSEEGLGDLLLAVTEVVANAHLHGAPPVLVRLWSEERAVVVDVHDHGTGPSDPLAGLLFTAEEDASEGRGLWLVHQLHVEVALIAGAGFRVRLRADLN